MASLNRTIAGFANEEDHLFSALIYPKLGCGWFEFCECRYCDLFVLTGVLAFNNTIVSRLAGIFQHTFYQI